jgi:LPXTG-site transpeptidase (sortase) family protein
VTVNESDGVATFTVSLSNPSSSTITVDYGTSDNTAIAGADYTTTSNVLTFAPGETSKTLGVPILEDLIDEPAETFFVNLSNPTNSTITDPTGVGTILDNDPIPSISINDVDPDNNIDSVYINIVSPKDQVLPATGFAPNRSIILPSQPAHLSYQNYGQLWLEIPTLGVEMSIVGAPLVENDWDVTWLWDKAGYLAGTAFPTWSGNSGITGHVVLANGINGPFARLKELEYGDAVIVHGWGEQYVYEIRETDIVSPHDPSVLRHEEFPWLTLVTCAGYDEASDSYRWRVVSRAVMVSIDTEANSWLSSRTKEQPEVHPFDRVGSGGVLP